VEEKGYMSRGGGGERLHVQGMCRRNAKCLGEVEDKGYISRGVGEERLRV